MSRPKQLEESEVWQGQFSTFDPVKRFQIGEILSRVARDLSVKRDVEDLLAHVLGIKRIDLYLQLERPLEEIEFNEFQKLVKRRSQGEPFVYLTGSVSFYGVELKIVPSVLIPRPETELLIDRICVQLKKENLEGKILWDVCTGSGCIAIALKKKFPKLKIIATDLCPEALKCASLNARQNEVQIFFRQGDLFAPFIDEQCHYFVSNPPYVSETEYNLLNPSVRNFEPKLALVGGEDGLSFYRRIALGLKKFLFPKGKGWLEIGTGQGRYIKKIFESTGWKKCNFSTDYAKHDRFFFLEKDSFNEVV
ncbi:MAG: peptide chain release factor N(5)-glutamine methyltransferase [Chlamydiia bacterium]|nr:peptide chain release factor N(5)-glutamine methyltransferase [Chlamydiia bacterium]